MLLIWRDYLSEYPRMNTCNRSCTNRTYDYRLYVVTPYSPRLLRKLPFTDLVILCNIEKECNRAAEIFYVRVNIEVSWRLFRKISTATLCRAGILRIYFCRGYSHDGFSVLLDCSHQLPHQEDILLHAKCGEGSPMRGTTRS